MLVGVGCNFRLRGEGGHVGGIEDATLLGYRMSLGRAAGERGDVSELRGSVLSRVCLLCLERAT